MKRRILSLVIAIALVLAMLPAAHLPADATTQEAWLWPVEDCLIISSNFGWRRLNSSEYNNQHRGIDIADGRGDLAVRASKSGLIITSINTCSHDDNSAICYCNGRAGNYIVIKHDDGTYSRYLHLRAAGMRASGRVNQGDIIGYMGSSGESYGYHLHFDMCTDINNKNSTMINPMPTNSEITIVNPYLLPDGWSSAKSTYIFDVIPPCEHPSYNSLGICTTCGAEFDFNATFDGNCTGIYKVTKSDGLYLRTDKPYDASTNKSEHIKVGTKVLVLGSVTNHYPNKWYKISYNGVIGYAYYEHLEWVDFATLNVTCSDFSPKDQAVLEKKAQPVIGTVNSNYPLSAIYAYLDGEQYASWHAGNKSTTQVSLRETDINYDLPFSSLSDGKHTIELIAHSFAHDTGVKCHSSVFYMTAKSDGDTRPGKPTLNVSVDDDFVTFTWGATVNTTHYNLWLAKKNSSDAWEEVEQIFYAQNGLSRTLQAGEYRAQLLSYNSNAWESDDSDWQHTWADDVFFTIEADTYTVAFDANGGTSAPSEQMVQCGSSLTLPSTIPERFGLNFTGWATTADADSATYQPGDTICVNSNFTLYAVWNVELINGIFENICNANINYSGAGYYYEYIPGYSTNWRFYSTGTDDCRVSVYDAYGNLIGRDDDGGGNRQFLLDCYLNANDIYCIYVDFYGGSATGEIPFKIARGFSVRFDANGGEGGPSTFTKYYDIDTTLSEIVPTREGYTFVGWDNHPAATFAMSQPGDSFVYNGDITLYAVWVKKVYTVHFNANGGTDAPAEQTVQCGDVLTLPSTIPECFGRNFMGWALNPNALTTDYQPGDAIEIDGNTTLYAIWDAVYTLGAHGYYCGNPVINYPGTGWYHRFLPAVSTYYRLYGTDETDTRVYLYDENGNLLAGDDDSGDNRQFVLEPYLYAGQVYYIYVSFYSGTATGMLNYDIARGYQINYDANGGNGADNSFIKYDSIDATLSSVAPTRKGYTFLGWSADSDATAATYQPSGVFSENADTTLYAVWNDECDSSGHDYIYHITTAPTASATGMLTGTCSNCSATTVVTLPVLNTTDYSYVVKTEPSYTATGIGCYTWKTSDYGDFSFDVELDKLFAAGSIVVQSEAATSGGKVTLTVTLNNNPGVAFLALTPVYDTSVLTLVSVENGTIIRDFDSGDNFTWSASEDTTENGTLLRLTFKVSEDAAPGNYEVRLIFREAYTLIGEDVSFEIEDGTVTVSDILYGDANGDGIVNGKDVLLLRRYMAYYNYDTGTSTVEIFPGGDANGDGIVNGKDVLLLRRYMAYYDYDTGTSSVVLGPN